VLKRTVREFIERCPFAGESGQGPAGGAGATWVLLKQARGPVQRSR
jgi:DNA-nicking Smr family endonuclease